MAEYSTKQAVVFKISLNHLNLSQEKSRLLSLTCGVCLEEVQRCSQDRIKHLIVQPTAALHQRRKE